MPSLYLVATPIGNLEDITLRALRVLREVTLIAAEDTRTTRKLLTHHGIKQRLLSYNEHNAKARTPQLLSILAGADVALVSEAGTPGVSDPGYELTLAAIEAGFSVVPVPGPAAIIAALMVSGLPMRQFTFLGFLPRRSPERRRLFSSLADEPRTLVAFESPHRLCPTLEDIVSTLGDRRIAVCREMTKAFEEVFRGRIKEALAHFAEPRGEFTLVIEGAAAERQPIAENLVIDRLLQLKTQRLRSREAVRQVAAEFGLPHRQVYRIWVDLSNATP